MTTRLLCVRTKRKTLTSGLKLRVAAKQQWKCALCKELLPFTYECDHIISLGMGGLDMESNLQALCNGCHAQKTVSDRETRQLFIQGAEYEKQTGKSKYFQGGPMDLTNDLTWLKFWRNR